MQLIAHRGASCDAPENTLEAFDRAEKQGADGMEFDVRLAACGTPVIIHDATLTRTHGIEARVAEMEADTLEALGVPLLATVLWRYAERMRQFIEAKTPDSALAAAVQMELLREGGIPEENLVLIAFDHAGLAAAKAEFPAIVTGASYDTPPDPLASRALRCAPGWLAVRSDCISARTVMEAMQAGLQLVAWTVNTREEARRLHLLGVDALMTDMPQQARGWLT